MARRKRETRTSVDAMLADLGEEGLLEEALAQEEESAKKPRKQRSDYKGPRDWEEIAKQHGAPATYRIPSTLRDEIKARAETKKIKIGGLVTILLQHALDELDAGRLELPEDD